MEAEFKFDVAFSFCQEDEELALEIADYLSDSVKSFIYSQHQKELVGKDGEIEFKQVFSEKARVVVVLYRKKYGSTKWTRIEEEAIRNRAYENGYDFTLYISLEKEAPVPKYLPKTRIWYKIERYGSKEAAAIISFFITEQGGETKEISAKEKAVKLKRKLEFKEKLEKYKDSHEAVGNALKEFDKLLEFVEKKAKEVFDGFNIGIISEHRRFLKLTYLNFQIEFYWRHYIANSLEKSGLKISFFDISSRNPSIIEGYDYDFEKNTNWENIWKLRNGDNEKYKSEILVDKCLKEFMDLIERENFNENEDGPQLFFI